MDLKEKIIESAYRLFVEKGFEKTTISDIIKTAGGSKGGFYHHFASKDAVLETITLNFIDDVMIYYHKLQDKVPDTVIDRFNSVFSTINKAKTDRISYWPEYSAIYSFNGSHIFIMKMAQKFEEVTTDIYKEIINRGVLEKIFHTNHPEYLAGMWTRELLRIYTILPKVILSTNESEYENFIKLLDFSENLINRELGLSENQIVVKKPALDYVEKCRSEYTGI